MNLFYNINNLILFIIDFMIDFDIQVILFSNNKKL